MLVIGAAGLSCAKAARAPELRDLRAAGLEAGFTAMLFLTGLSGLLL